MVRLVGGVAGFLCVSIFGQAAPDYVGAAACTKCHQTEHDKWAGSRHSKMVQPATPAGVKGDFGRGSIELHGAAYKVRSHDGAYFVTESDLTGKAEEYRVDYTLGNRRIQHYLTTLASGRIVVLTPSWDILRKEWFHSSEIADPYQTEGDLPTVQVWNKNCYSCHVSKQENNFDLETNTYKVAWIDFGTNCERCHGPGSDHVAHYSAAEKPSGTPHDIVLQTRLDARRNTMVCAQCHSLRDTYVKGFTAGSSYFDSFLPILEFSQPVQRDISYWPDGRTRRFSNDAIGFWQSECFLKGGATCLDCHSEAHETEIERNPQLRPDANALCTRCHSAIGEKITTHTHHRAESAGSSCVECHMPRTVVSIKAQIRDHSMSIPVPENTIRHNIPNACNVCHQDRDAAWSAAQMNQWWSDASRQKWIRRADAFTAARAGDPASIEMLARILGERSEGPIARANAAGYLGKFAVDPVAFAALKNSLTDAEPVVRAIAALGMHPGAADKEDAIAALRQALGDGSPPVRMAAAAGLVGLGLRDLPDEDGRKFIAAKKLVEARAELNSDDAVQQFAVGRLYYLTGEFAKAEYSFAATLKLDPGAIPAVYYLGLALAQEKKIGEAREVLKQIEPGAPEYRQAQELLHELGPN
jgi:predicted CXXCH cytochrome family protein